MKKLSSVTWEYSLHILYTREYSLRCDCESLFLLTAVRFTEKIIFSTLITIQVKYSIERDTQILFSGQVNVCNVSSAKSAQDKEILELFAFPTECPLSEGRICTDGTKKVDISKYKDFLSFLEGDLIGKYDVTHDTVAMNIYLFVHINVHRSHLKKMIQLLG